PRWRLLPRHRKLTPPRLPASRHGTAADTRWASAAARRGLSARVLGTACRRYSPRGHTARGRLLDPVERLGHGLLPVVVLALPAGLVHGGLPFLVLGPVRDR